MITQSVKWLASRLATYLCRAGSNCPCGMLAKISSGLHLPGCVGFTDCCPGFPPAADSRPKCVFKSLEMLDLTSIPEVIPAHMCLRMIIKACKVNKSNINHFKLCVSLFKNTTSLMILEKPWIIRLCKSILILSCGFLCIGIFPAEGAVVDFSRQHCMIGKLLPTQVIKYL